MIGWEAFMEPVTSGRNVMMIAIGWTMHSCMPDYLHFDVSDWLRHIHLTRNIMLIKIGCKMQACIIINIYTLVIAWDESHSSMLITIKALSNARLYHHDYLYFSDRSRVI